MLLNFFKTKTICEKQDAKKILYKCRRSSLEGAAVVFCDLNKLKFINDNYGHDKGDIMIECFSQTLVESVRSTDRIIKFGGDEFVVIFMGIIESELQTKLETIQKSFTSKCSDTLPIPVSAAMGAIFVDSPRELSEETIQKADKLMYLAKQAFSKIVIESKNSPIKSDIIEDSRRRDHAGECARKLFDFMLAHLSRGSDMDVAILMLVMRNIWSKNQTDVVNKFCFAKLETMIKKGYNQMTQNKAA